MYDFIGAAIQFGLPSTVTILIVLLPIGILAILKMIQKMRRLNDKINRVLAESLLKLIDLHSDVLPEKK
jgi:hypothetical protein